jgi:hypothetical protein
MLPPSCNRLVLLGIATFAFIVLIFTALHQGGGPIRTIKEAAKNAAGAAATPSHPQQ